MTSNLTTITEARQKASKWMTLGKRGFVAYIFYLIACVLVGFFASILWLFLLPTTVFIGVWFSYYDYKLRRMQVRPYSLTCALDNFRAISHSYRVPSEFISHIRVNHANHFKESTLHKIGGTTGWLLPVWKDWLAAGNVVIQELEPSSTAAIQDLQSSASMSTVSSAVVSYNQEMQANDRKLLGDLIRRMGYGQIAEGRVPRGTKIGLVDHRGSILRVLLLDESGNWVFKDKSQLRAISARPLPDHFSVEEWLSRA